MLAARRITPTIIPTRGNRPQPFLCEAETIRKPPQSWKSNESVSDKEIMHLQCLAAKRNAPPKEDRKTAIPKKEVPKVLAIHLRAIAGAERLERELKRGANGETETIKRKLKRLSKAKTIAERIVVSDLEIRYLRELASEGKVLRREEENRLFGIYSSAIEHIGRLEGRLGSQVDVKMRYGRLEEAKKLAGSTVVGEMDGLLWKNARRIPHPPSILLEDMVQEGREAIIERAMPKFDRMMGNRFSTYGMWWARQAMRRMIQDCGKDIRQPVHIYDTMSRIGKASRQHFKETGAEPSAEELAQRTELSVKSVKNCLAFPKMVSMNKKRRQGEAPEMMETLSDETVTTPEEVALRGEVGAVLERLLATLKPDDADVMRKNFGVGYEREHSHTEIAKERGVSKSRGGQIVQKILRELRKKAERLRREGYEPYRSEHSA